MSELTPVDWWVLIIALLVLAVINGGYLGYMYFISRTREAHDIYSIIWSSIACHFANWGVAEFYLINGYWYMLGYSVAQTIGKAYWFMAWGLAVFPIFTMAVMLVFYFLEGYKQVKEGMKNIYLQILDEKTKTFDILEKYVAAVAHTILGTNRIFEDESKKKIFFKSVLSGGVGWGVGNILQDRICGLLCVAVAKPELKFDLWNIYVTFNGDVMGALTQWILPIVVFSTLALIYIYFK